MAEVYKIGNDKVKFFGKLRGNNSNKFNRVNKLAAQYNPLRTKMVGMVERGNLDTLHSRCALCVLFLMETGIRIGNEGSAEGYHTVPHPHAKNQESKFVQTYGLLTLLRKHVKSGAGGVRFEFVGKKQVDNKFHLPVYLAAYTRILHKERPPHEPFFGVTVYELNKFIKKYVGKEFSAKDFRTLRANVYAHNFLKGEIRFEIPETKKEKKALVTHVCTSVSELLNNTPGVVRKSYVCPKLFTDTLAL